MASEVNPELENVAEEETGSPVVNIAELKKRPCSLDNVVIEGNEKTDAKIIEHYLEKAKKATTLGEVTDALQIAREELMELGIFDVVDIVVDAGPVETPESAAAYVSVQENTGLALSAGTYLRGQEPMAEASGEIKNRFGKAEALQGNVSMGKDNSTAFSFALHLPHFISSRRGQLRKEIHQTWHHWKRFSSHSQSLRGFKVAYREKNHALAYDLTWRKNTVDAEASPAVRRMMGHSLLSGLTYSYTLNRLDDARLRPTHGYALSTSTQIAGLGIGDNFVRFVKQQISAAVAVPLPFLNAAFTSSIRAGVLLPWSTNGRPPMINDKFFVGGPNPLRGFRTHGLGPSSPRADNSGHDRIGGDLLLAGTAGLSFDLPSVHLRKWGIHGHGFACAANLMALSDVAESIRAPQQLALDVLNGTRCSAGVGLVSCSKVLGRVELNYCWVLRKQETDKVVKHGIQICWNGSPP